MRKPSVSVGAIFRSQKGLNWTLTRSWNEFVGNRDTERTVYTNKYTGHRIVVVKGVLITLTDLTKTELYGLTRHHWEYYPIDAIRIKNGG